MSRIEQINELPLDNIDKFNLTLVYAGVMPSAMLKFIDFDNFDEEANIARLSPKNVYDLAIGFNQIGFPYHFGQAEIKLFGRDESQPKHEVLTLYIGKNRRWLDRLVMANSDIEYGKCFGYPDTAISAYVGEIERLNSPVNVNPPELVNFVTFARSKQHWTEEMQEVRHRAAVVRKLNPKLYDLIANPSEIVYLTQPVE